MWLLTLIARRTVLPKPKCAPVLWGLVNHADSATGGLGQGPGSCIAEQLLGWTIAPDLGTPL